MLPDYNNVVNAITAVYTARGGANPPAESDPQMATLKEVVSQAHARLIAVIKQGNRGVTSGGAAVVLGSTNRGQASRGGVIQDPMVEGINRVVDGIGTSNATLGRVETQLIRIAARTRNTAANVTAVVTAVDGVNSSFQALNTTLGQLQTTVNEIRDRQQRRDNGLPGNEQTGGNADILSGLIDATDESETGGGA